MAKIPKPKVLGDVNFVDRSRPRDNFSSLPHRLNLSYRRTLRIPITRALKLILFVASASLLVLGSATAPTIFIRASGQSSDEERQTLEAQLQELESQIGEYEEQIIGYQKQGRTLKGEIGRLGNKIAKLNLQIRAINLTINELDKNIEDTGEKITITENSIDAYKISLGRLLQNLYENERASLIEIFLKSPRLSDFFGDLQGITLLQSSLRIEVGRITDLRNQLEDQQDQLLFARADAKSASNYRAAQKSEINSAKSEKNKLLAITKGQESKYQSLLKETKKTAAQIRSRIFQLLGGGELSFEEAYEYAKLASGATGIRPAMILAVLDRESALGQNVGRCSYKSAMSPSNQKRFLEITAELNINPDVVTVSCPNRDGVYGGAMGPAQFIPSTWNLYKDSVAKVTGSSLASPWNNADAFVATALYLRDSYNSRSCRKYSQQIPSQERTLLERCAAAKYYAGSRWYYYRWTYGEAVVIRARSFQEDIDTITS